MAALDVTAGQLGAPDRASFATWAAVFGGIIGAFMAVLNIQITNASLLDIEGGIGTGVDNGAWITTAYLIGEIIVIPLSDYLSRVFSFRRYLITNTVLFLVFSTSCSFTHSLGEMIVVRALQGFTGGVLIPMSFTLVLTKLPKAQQPPGYQPYFYDRPKICSKRPDGRSFDCPHYADMHIDNGLLCGSYVLESQVFHPCFQPVR